MHKKTKGYTLLLLLVLTGLAGRQSTTTITSKERRFLLEQLKESKAGIQKAVKGLSAEQLSFKVSTEAASINENLQEIAFTEVFLWNITNAALKHPSTAQFSNDAKITDEQILAALIPNEKWELPESFQAEKLKWKTTESALETFKDQRADLIKYAKTSTDDMRNYAVKMPFGTVDAYQLLLYISAVTKHHELQIEEIKSNPAFPK